ncbi:MAG: PAC2 family protein [Candidatus Omnitrophica bacterium]|nr:PAC2 family protein [Candidatus Omnitrophota bacterium]
MEGIKFSKRPRLKNPFLIVAWPGMGEVAFKAANYLIEELKAEEFASIPPEEFFYLTNSLVQQGILSVPDLPYSKFYYCKNKSGKNDFIIFISNAQPDLAHADAYSRRVIQAAKSFKIDTVISFASMPLGIDHTQESAVWFAATSSELSNKLKKIGLNVLLEGAISGMNGLFLGIAKREGLKGFCLLGEIPLYTIQIDNPKASYAVLKALSRMLNLNINLTGLINQARNMEAEINKLLDYLKLGGQAAGPIQEEDIEKIKHSLSQLTKLPLSIKSKIEELFSFSKIDITRAAELKAELDKWNVYKEYEDRFLDLFKKNEEKNN